MRDYQQTKKEIIMQGLAIEASKGGMKTLVFWYDIKTKEGVKRVFETDGKNVEKDLFYIQAAIGMEQIELERKKQKENNHDT